MGLLDHIESGIETKKESILTETQSQKLSFFDFVTSHSLPYAAVFMRCDNNFIISYSIGFDCDSIASSFSTVDFWKGLLKKEQWTYFSKTDNSILPVLQFLSKQLKDKIIFIGAYYLDEMIFFVANEKNLLSIQEFDKISADFNNIDFMMPNKILNTSNTLSPKCKVIFEYKNALIDFSSNIQKSITNPVAASKVNAAIRMELEYKLKTLSSKTVSFVKSDTFSIVCNNYSESNVSEAALKSFIKLNLKSIFGKSVNLITYAN